MKVFHYFTFRHCFVCGGGGEVDIHCVYILYTGTTNFIHAEQIHRIPQVICQKLANIAKNRILPASLMYREQARIVQYNNYSLKHVYKKRLFNFTKQTSQETT